MRSRKAQKVIPNYQSNFQHQIKVIRVSLALFVYFIAVIGLTLSNLQVEFQYIEFTIWLMSIIQMVRIFLYGRIDSLGIILATTGIFLFYLPSLAIVSILQLDIVLPLFVFIATVDLLNYFTRSVKKIIPKVTSPRRLPILKWPLLWWVILAIWMSISGAIIDTQRGDFLSPFLFFVPFGLSLVIYEKMLSEGLNKKASLLIIAAYFLLVFLYTVFYWSGFGRLVVGAFILMPVLLLNAYRDVGVRLWYVILSAPIILYFAQKTRYTSIEGAQQVFIGSAGHHLILTNDLQYRPISQYFGGWDIFFEQYLLLFLNWFPRVLWPDKPIGLGLTSVDTMFGRRGLGVGEGYSQSLSFVGEQLYSLGGWFFIGLSVTLVTLFLLRLFVARCSRGFVTPLIIFDVNLISYFWGGSATFGSRVWFFLLPTILFIWVFRRFKWGEVKEISIMSLRRGNKEIDVSAMKASRNQ